MGNSSSRNNGRRQRPSTDGSLSGGSERPPSTGPWSSLRRSTRLLRSRSMSLLSMRRDSSNANPSAPRSTNVTDLDLIASTQSSLALAPLSSRSTANTLQTQLDTTQRSSQQASLTSTSADSLFPRRSRSGSTDSLDLSPSRDPDSTRYDPIADSLLYSPRRTSSPRLASPSSEVSLRRRTGFTLDEPYPRSHDSDGNRPSLFDDTGDHRYGGRMSAASLFSELAAHAPSPSGNGTGMQVVYAGNLAGHPNTSIIIVYVGVTRRESNGEGTGEAVERPQRNWVIYLISGSRDSLGGDSYEELLALQERLGFVHRGASRADVEQLDEHVFRKGETPDGRCAICLAEYCTDDHLRKLPCKHDFHRECVDKWLVEQCNSCPLCRTAAVVVAPATTS